jgi:hypothetical protein
MMGEQCHSRINLGLYPGGNFASASKPTLWPFSPTGATVRHTGRPSFHLRIGARGPLQRCGLSQGSARPDHKGNARDQRAIDSGLPTPHLGHALMGILAMH